MSTLAPDQVTALLAALADMLEFVSPSPVQQIRIVTTKVSSKVEALYWRKGVKPAVAHVYVRGRFRQPLPVGTLAFRRMEAMTLKAVIRGLTTNGVLPVTTIEDRQGLPVLIFRHDGAEYRIATIDPDKVLAGQPEFPDDYEIVTVIDKAKVASLRRLASIGASDRLARLAPAIVDGWLMFKAGSFGIAGGGARVQTGVWGLAPDNLTIVDPKLYDASELHAACRNAIKPNGSADFYMNADGPIKLAFASTHLEWEYILPGFYP